MSARIKYCPVVPEDPQPESAVSQWSLGIAMFAAFVIPFVLFVTSARYRLFVDQARISFEQITNSHSAQPIDQSTPTPSHD